MHHRTKIALGAAALVAAGLGVTDARAGNLALGGPVRYFSVSVPAGYRVTYTGPNQAGTTMVVDDITYAANIDPAMAQQRSRYFPHGMMAVYWQPIYGGTNPNGANADPFPIYQYIEARGTDNVLAVREGGPVAPTGDFDRMTHSTHAELYAVTTFAADEGSWVWHAPTGDPNQTGVGSGGYWEYTPPAHPPEPGNLLDWNLMGVAMSSWATPTAQSRHYQSPQIVQPTNYVEVVDLSTGNGKYLNATVYLKGRLYDGNPAPTESSLQLTLTQLP